MLISLVGDCDKRPVLYSVLKICQALGDVLLVTDDPKALRLSDTGASEGHYQNCMIAYTEDGIDEFLQGFAYGTSDFEYIIVCNMVTFDADLTIYVKSLIQSDDEEAMLEYLDAYETIEIFNGRCIDKSTMLRVEEFEAYKNMPPMNAGIVNEVAKCLATKLRKDAKSIAEIGMVQNPAPDTAKSSSSKLPISIPKFGGGKKK